MKNFIDKERIKELLENIKNQINYLESASSSISNSNFFEKPSNLERTKAIKYSLACAIEDVCRIALRIGIGMGWIEAKKGYTEAILTLGENDALPKELAQHIKLMPGFRNRLIHDYLPNKFDAQRLYNAMQNLDDFKKFSSYIIKWVEKYGKI